MKIAICDDEQRELEKTKALLEKYRQEVQKDFEVLTFISGEELLKSKEKFDIVFLDIEMPDRDGIELGKQLMRYQDTYFIYVTSYVDYWRRAFNEVHAFAFLEKPLTWEILQEQMQEIEADRCRKAANHKMTFEILTVDDIELKRKHTEFILEDIFYFEFVNRKIRLKQCEKEYFFAGKLGDIERKCEAYGFARCHSAYVVNIRHISRVEKSEVCLANGERIPLAQRRSAEFRKKVNAFIHSI
ncbi:MAG: response regulator transcription factor [Lachnospiraceae bacterium]|nr:response regulator transcription factor [Lachnospiraceae bacterium]